MDNQPNSFDRNSEFFLLASYSCLPTVVTRLNELQYQNIKAILYCYTIQLYKFLSPLAETYDWIKVFYIDDSELNRVSPYRPWKIFHWRKLLKSIYHQWFSIIPSGCRVNFYNRYYALSTFFMIWLIKKKCEIHFADCDYSTKYCLNINVSLYSILKSFFLTIIYPMPFEMLSGGDGGKPFPALNKVFFDKTIKTRQLMVTDLSELKHTELFHQLSFKSSKKVLWLMSPVLDLGIVPSEEYKQTLNGCITLVNSIFSPDQQAVKFHPRSKLREKFLNEKVEFIPNYFPIEFVDMPNLIVVIALSTSSLWSFSSNTKVIGLIDILPFTSVNAHKAYRQSFCFYKTCSKKYLPSSIIELKQILLSKEIIEDL
jgi:hypothetical protein